MKKKQNRDVLAIINDFQKIIDKKPPLSQMLDEVRMMEFKIHPVAGDISQIDLKNNKLLETIWSLGKLDELFQKEYIRLPAKDKNVFVRIFDGFYQQFQTELSTNSTPILEMEIFREKQSLKRIN